MSLRNRIILMYALLVAGAFACVIYLITNDIRPRYLEAVEESTVDIAEFLAVSLSQQIENGVLNLDAVNTAMSDLSKRTFSAQIYNINKQKVTLRIYITDAQGTLLYDSTGTERPGADFSQWRDVYLTLRGRYGARSTKMNPHDPASRVIFVAAPIMHNGEIFGVVSVGKPTDSVSFFVAIAHKRFFISLALIGLTAIALSIILSAWITWPVKRLIRYMHAVRQGTAERLPALGSSEMGDLGAALEDMQAKLAGKNYIEDYVRALTHELKSPLTGIKGAAEILRDHVSENDTRGVKFLDNIDSEAQRLQSLVERMLQLSRLENVRVITKSRFPAGKLFRELASAFQTQLEKKQLTLELHVPETLHMEGDELLLRQAFGNLIANSIDFSPPDTKIMVTAVATAQTLTISVKDQGTGIPEFAQGKVFDKFFSLDRPGTGKKSTGLGLPFVKEVVLLHGGEVEIANNGREVRSGTVSTSDGGTGNGIGNGTDNGKEMGDRMGLEVRIALPL